MATKKKMTRTAEAAAETAAEVAIEPVEAPVDATVETPEVDGGIAEGMEETAGVPVLETGEMPEADMDAVPDEIEEGVIDVAEPEEEAGEPDENPDVTEVEAPAETVFSDVPMPEAADETTAAEEREKRVGLTGLFMPPLPDVLSNKGRDSGDEDAAVRKEKRKAMIERIRASMKSHIDKLNEARENVEASDLKEAPVPEKIDEEKAIREERRRLYEMAWAAMQNN